MNSPKPLKLKKCKVCREQFAPYNSIQPTCGKYECQVEYATAHAQRAAMRRARQERKETRAAKERQMTLSDWLKRVERECNKYIKLRDANDGCISCGTRNPNITYAAGHYRTVKAASHLRFNEDNIHKQCNYNCNSQKSGNVVEYRIRLVKKIGLERVEALENDNRTHRYTIDECKQLIAYFKAKCKALSTNQGE